MRRTLFRAGGATVGLAALLGSCVFLAASARAAPASPPPARARAAPPPGNPIRGAALYESRCGACHALDADRIGPRHRGVYGRRAGQVARFAYTPALKASRLVWDAPTLDRWLAAPPVLVKGTAMGYRLPAAQDRADVIAYLASSAAR